MKIKQQIFIPKVRFEVYMMDKLVKLQAHHLVKHCLCKYLHGNYDELIMRIVEYITHVTKARQRFQPASNKNDKEAAELRLLSSSLWKLHSLAIQKVKIENY
jgi:hypothetical protein